MSNIYIYMSTFGKKTYNQNHGIPIEVGAALRNNYVYDLRDNCGDNISDQNQYYGELTGLYWVWKNTVHKSDDIIGFFHYNKGIDINEKEIRKNIENNSWIVLNRCHNNKHPIKKEIELTRSIIEKDYPRYIEVWDRVYDLDGSGYLCNPAQMFITKYGQFCDYCDFLFGVLSKLRIEIGDVDSSPYYKRYCAFMGERLLTVFMIGNNINYVEYGMKYPNYFKTILRRIRDSIGIKEDNKTYRIFQKYFGRKSQYLK